MKKTSGHGDDEQQQQQQQYDDDDIIDPAVQRGYGSVATNKSAARPQSSSSASVSVAAAPPSFAVKFGKKIRQKLSVGPAGAETRPSSSKRESGAGRTSASKKVEYEEMEDMHWSEI